jgi:peptide/nickel transport system substrate-binding protein
MDARGLPALAALCGLWACGCRGPRSEPARPLTVSVPYDAGSLEPGRRDRLSDFAVLSNAYETLVTTDARLSIAPALATRWENPDERTWVFHLRRLVRFHDGRPLTPDDVVFSFRRLLDDPTLEASRHLVAVEDVRRASDSSVVIRTRTPLADFLYRVRFIHVVPRGATRAALLSRVDGTGPYRVVSFRPGEEVVFERNDAYWGAPPAFPRAVLRLNRAPADALADLEAGRSDLVQAASRDARARAGPGVRVHKVPSITVKLLLLDVERERSPHVVGGRNPFRDLRVREAVHLALDRTRFAGLLRGPAVPAYQLVPPYIFGFDPDLPVPVHDVARARALLAQAGWPEGFRVTLHARELLSDGAEAVRELLAPAGIRVDVRLLPESEYFEATGAARRDFAMALTRFGCPTGDAANFLDAALHTREAATGLGRANTGGYSSPEADRLLAEAARTLDPPRRKAVLQRLMRLALHDLPWIPLYVEEEVYLSRPQIAWEPRLDNYVLLAEIRLR